MVCFGMYDEDEDDNERPSQGEKWSPTLPKTKGKHCYCTTNMYFYIHDIFSPLFFTPLSTLSSCTMRIWAIVTNTDFCLFPRFYINSKQPVTTGRQIPLAILSLFPPISKKEKRHAALLHHHGQVGMCFIYSFFLPLLSLFLFPDTPQ